ncbi:Mrp/NBP35 family ATP-binding protein [Thermoflexibacter ruber]|uniref:Iron-sulfur cluster carrier protein n=1 Tax=Thermoflexibacter ruber TaxID=1003 RepID=A0A1I2IZK4_9BACT|nr:Mrp/NBP35 family ATP-binding protein [Thermoflexibacter ruber]SFF47148.1 ATP-binding protein involved in chromosome partitioning [Thermoflexibacter ruber]
MTKEDILKALATVEEPDLKKDLVSLNMVQNIGIQGKVVRFTIVLTTPACPLKELIRHNCEKAIHKLVDAEAQVFIDMTASVTTLRDSTPLLPKVRNIVAIASGKGGVGKSTVTANLAMSLANTGAKVGIIDADIFGPSMPTMFNCESARPGLINQNGKQLLLPVEQYGIKILSIGFLAPPDDAVVWRGPMASSALRQFISDTDWGELDYMLIDLPPGTSDIHLTLVQTVPVTGAVIVTTPQKVALADAQKGLAMFRQKQINVPILGVVENMAYFTPAELPENKYYIFGKDGGKILANRNQVPFLGEIPLVQSIRESGDKGKPIVTQQDNPVAIAFQEVAEKLAQNIAIRNAQVALV